MPVDTREKRNSAQAFLVPIFAPGIAPSTIDQGERQAAAWMYSGILAASLTPGHPAARRLEGVVFATRTLHRRGVNVFRETVQGLVRLGMSQRAVGRLLGVSHTTVWRHAHACG